MCSGLKEINYQFGVGGGVRKKQVCDKTWETDIKVERKEGDDENLAVFYFMFFVQEQRESEEQSPCLFGELPSQF